MIMNNKRPFFKIFRLFGDNLISLYCKICLITSILRKLWTTFGMNIRQSKTYLWILLLQIVIFFFKLFHSSFWLFNCIYFGIFLSFKQCTVRNLLDNISHKILFFFGSSFSQLLLLEFLLHLLFHLFRLFINHFQHHSTFVLNLYYS